MLEAQDRLGVEQKGNCRKYLQRFRRQHVFISERKKTTTKHTHETYYLWDLHVSFRIHGGVSNASEVDFLFLNADEQMELTTTMSDRQKLAATVIIAQIKLERTRHPRD